MKSIKRLMSLFRAQHILSKKGLFFLIILLKFFLKIRGINPKNWFRKDRFSHDKTLSDIVNELKPILLKTSEIISIQPELINETLETISSTLKDVPQHNASRRSITIEHNDSIPPASAAVELEQHIKNFLTESNLTSCPENKPTFSFEQLIDKGIFLTRQCSDVIENHRTNYLHEEIQVSTTPIKWSDFINKIDVLSLGAERLQFQVNQLMSLHEIN